MSKNNFLILVLSALCCFIKTYGQISTDELPYSFTMGTYGALPVPMMKTTASLNLLTIEQEDSVDAENGIPPRFGYRHNVNYNLNNSGTWTTFPNGDKLWRLTIFCPNALSINLLYDQFWLYDGAKLFIYSEDEQQTLGAFTSSNNGGTVSNPKGFATGLIYSDKIILEYYQPNGTPQGIVSIASIVHGYRYILLDFGDSDNCQVNVNCEEGADWQNEKNAVALIIVDGNRYCTGSLINTTANDFRPLLLTADHCLGGWANSPRHDAISAPNLDEWSFYWNYETPNCTGNNEPLIKSTVGATVVANNGATDFALLELREDPKNRNDVNTYYLGWDRSGIAGTGGVGIHHPLGDVKKIATYNTTPVNSNCMNYSNDMGVYMSNSNFWLVNWIQTTNGFSVMQPGSSGSPLINSNHRVIGQLYGNGTCSRDQCNNPSNQRVSYGKLSVSWNNSADSRRRLRDWLDPINSSATILDGKNYCKSILINNKTYPSVIQDLFGITNFYIDGCNVEFVNTTVKSNATLHVVANEKVTLNLGFWAKAGSNVSLQISSQGVAAMPSVNQSEAVSETYDDVLSVKPVVEISSQIASIKVYSLTGMLVYSSNSDFDINSSGLKQGVYIIEKRYLNGRVERRIFFKK